MKNVPSAMRLRLGMIKGRLRGILIGIRINKPKDWNKIMMTIVCENCDEVFESYRDLLEHKKLCQTNKEFVEKET